MKSSNKFSRLFFFCFFILAFLTSILLIRGDKTYPKIIEISPQEEILSNNTNQIVLIFNRNMDRASVEKNFSTEPQTTGKFSWIGKKMAYSLTEALEAGDQLKVKLSDAKDEKGVVMKEAFEKIYQTQGQHLYFIGTEGVQTKRLMRYEMNSKKLEVWSPEKLEIKDFKVSQDESMVYLFGIEKGGDPEKNSLYAWDRAKNILEKIVDGEKEFIFSFNLSPNGEMLLVRKAEFSRFDEYSLADPGKFWVYQAKEEKWSNFWNEELYGNEMYFSPDSNYLVGRLINGDVIILPVEEKPEAVVYLEDYGGSYNLSPDGSKLVFVDFEDPFEAQDLVLRANNGESQKLLEDIGQIQFPAFDQRGKRIYFLLSLAGEGFEKTGVLELNPYHLYAYNLETNDLEQITEDDAFFEGYFSVASNSNIIAFERYESAESGLFFESQLEGEVISELWIYNWESKETESLKLKGVKPFLN